MYVNSLKVAKADKENEERTIHVQPIEIERVKEPIEEAPKRKLRSKS